MLCICIAQGVSKLVPDFVAVEPQSLSPQSSRFLDLPPAPKYHVNDAVHSDKLLYKYKPLIAHTTTAATSPALPRLNTYAHTHMLTHARTHTHTHARV